MKNKNSYIECFEINEHTYRINGKIYNLLKLSPEQKEKLGEHLEHLYTLQATKTENIYEHLQSSVAKTQRMLKMLNHVTGIFRIARGPVSFTQLTDTTFQINQETITLTDLSFQQINDLKAAITTLEDQQQHEIERIEERLQTYQNSKTGLSLLTKQLEQLAEDLSPTRRIFRKGYPDIFIDLPRDEANRQVSTGDWGYSPEMVTVISSHQEQLQAA